MSKILIQSKQNYGKSLQPKITSILYTDGQTDEQANSSIPQKTFLPQGNIIMSRPITTQFVLTNIVSFSHMFSTPSDNFGSYVSILNRP